jgi:hypothetical protein
MFAITEGDNRQRWIRIGILTTAIGNLMNGLSFIITGTSNFGDNTPGMDIVQVSTRGGIKLQAYTLVPSSTPQTTYGYRNVGGNTEIWIHEGPYNYEKNCVVTFARNGTGTAQFGILTTQYTQPLSPGLTLINTNRYALQFDTSWQGTNTQHGGPVANPTDIDVSAAHNCIRISTTVNGRFFRIIGNTNQAIRGKTFRIVNTNPGATGGVDAHVIITSGGIIITTLIIPPNCFGDVYVDGTGRVYLQTIGER